MYFITYYINECAFYFVCILCFNYLFIKYIYFRYSNELHYESTTTINITESISRTSKHNKVTCFSFIIELFSCRCNSVPTQTSQVLFKTLLYTLCKYIFTQVTR